MDESLIWRNSSSHQSSPSLLTRYLSVLPLPTPEIVYTALSTIRPFISQVTPFSPARHQYSALAVSYTFTLATGNVTQLNLALSNTGANLRDGLLNIPSKAGYRAFDVLYYLLTSASTPAEREFLSLKNASAYNLLNKSGTYDPPSYLPTADDAASAEDFRAGLKAIGIRGAAHRSLISVLAALLKLGDAAGFLVDEEELESVCEDVGGLLNVDPIFLLRTCTTDDREALIRGIFEALLDWVISKANQTIASELQAAQENDSSDGGYTGDTVCLTVLDVPDPALGKAIALRGVFDDSLGINAEIKEDGIEVAGPGHSVINEMRNAVADVAVALGETETPAGRDYEYQRDKVQGVLERIGVETEPGSFLRQVLYPINNEVISLGRHGRFDLTSMLNGNRLWYHISIHPTDDSAATLASLPSVTSAWSAGTISRQLREWRFPEWANRRNKHLDYTSDFDVDEFVTRYARLGCQEGRDGVENWVIERGWSNGEVVVGKERIWMREGAWWEAESMLDLKPQEEVVNPFNSLMMASPFDNGYEATPPPTNANASGFFPAMEGMGVSTQDSHENLLYGRNPDMAPSVIAGSRSIAPTGQTMTGDYGLGGRGDQRRYDQEYEQDVELSGELDAELGSSKKIEHKTIPRSRRIWVGVVWALTFWMPSFALRYIGRMKRPDVRLAWREKFVLTAIIAFINCFIVFYIIFFGMIICPNKDKAWNPGQVAYHTGDDDFYVSLRGHVYDISKFWKIQHSDTVIESREDQMQQVAGKNLDAYFPIPMDIACRGFEIDPSYTLQHNNTGIIEVPLAEHISGSRSHYRQSALYDENWYNKKFLPKMNEFYKGDLVHSRDDVKRDAEQNDRQWVIINDWIYDLTDYFYSVKRMVGRDGYDFLPKEVTDLIKGNAGYDITDKWETSQDFRNSLKCMDNHFYVGRTDFRESGKCTFNNWILLAFTILICAVILVKFIAALQLGSKRNPVMQDKFVVCMVPAYTEGEDQLRKGLDSLTALQYDSKRKLIFVVCDGMIIGGGNDRPTPKIVLDILGVDPKVDPVALPFKSVGISSEQLNYGKVYSGLYEYEGNVVPYVVVVKVGKDSEQSKTKPGNRGKRDSQVLTLNFLNRVHHRAPMSPLELEIFHQINNVIGVDPELYEYIFMVDADTSVKEDSLNRLVASCANDGKIAGICGETSLENEERSWWTMIQVYEYFISHHLAKAFESLFGSVTCLPGWYVNDLNPPPSLRYSANCAALVFACTDYARLTRENL